jgi:hypothetical protein
MDPDLHGVLLGLIICDLLNLADLLSKVIMQQDQPDKHNWRMSVSGKYSAKLTYEASF